MPRRRGRCDRAARAAPRKLPDSGTSAPSSRRRLRPRPWAGGRRHDRLQWAHVSPRRRARERPLRPVARRRHRVRGPPGPGSGRRQLRRRLRARTERPRGAAVSAQHRVEAPVPDRARGDGPLRRVPRLRGGRRSSEPQDRCDTGGTRLGRPRLLFLLVRPWIDRLVLGGPGTRRPGIRRARARRRHVARGAEAGGPAATAAAGDHRPSPSQVSSQDRSRLHCPGLRRGTSRLQSGAGSRIPPEHSTGSSALVGSTCSAASPTSSPEFSRGAWAIASGRARPSAGRSTARPRTGMPTPRSRSLDLEAGRRTAALGHLRHAHRLNPLERTTRALLAVALRGEPVPASLAERLRPAGSGFAARPPSGRLPTGPRSLRRLLRPRGAAMNGAALARRRLAPQDALLGVATALAAFGLALVLAVTLARQPLTARSGGPRRSGARGDACARSRAVRRRRRARRRPARSRRRRPRARRISSSSS